MAEVEIRGAEEFVRLSPRLKESDKTIQREFSKALNNATKPLKADAKRSALSNLPKRGGLAAYVASVRLTTKRKTRGKTVGISIEAPRNRKQLELLDFAGRVKHPAFGNRKAWVTQSVPSGRGWFTDPMEAAGTKVRREITEAMRDVAKKIEG